MRLSFQDRAQLWMRQLPRMNWVSIAEIVLIALLAIQCARLVWAVATPVGPLGDWRSHDAQALAEPDMALFQSFDPFFRLDSGGPAVVTDLDITLFGIRQDQASGRGSAILSLPTGEQDSFAVGDEIMPGVTLESVDFDFVTISRNGRSEQVFLDQSTSSAPASPGPAAGASPASSPSAASSRSASPVQTRTVRRSTGQTVTPRQLAAATQISPRREGNRVTGIVLQPSGDNAEALSAAGFQPGDIIISINGERIQEMGQAVRFADSLASGDRFVQVERNGETVSFRARVSE